MLIKWIIDKAYIRYISMKYYSSNPTYIAINVKRLDEAVIEIRNYIDESIKEQTAVPYTQSPEITKIYQQ